jgi:hypothetical protein
MMEPSILLIIILLCLCVIPHGGFIILYFKIYENKITGAEKK